MTGAQLIKALEFAKVRARDDSQGFVTIVLTYGYINIATAEIHYTELPLCDLVEVVDQSSGYWLVNPVHVNWVQVGDALA